MKAAAVMAVVSGGCMGWVGLGVEGGGEREREKTEAFMTAAAVMAVLSGGCMGWVGVGVEGGGERERERERNKR